MKRLYKIFTLILTLSNITAQETSVALEIDTAWEKLKKTISKGDFNSFKSVYHQDAIFVNGILKKSYPIKNAFDGWKQGFDDTKSGIISAHLDVRFSQRLYDNFSAHETGIFHYYTINKEGKQSDSYVHFESLWVKKNNKWLMIMEYQKSSTDKDEWNELE